MDGVVSDTQKLHSKVECELLKRYGIILSPEAITRKYSGVKTKEFFGELLSQQDQSFDLDTLMEEKWQRMRALAEKSVDPVEGALDLVQMLRGNGFPLAIASASNMNYVKTVLKTLEIADHFLAIVSGDMVQRGKPDPESFLLASKKIGIPPEECLVFEDGISGMQAAINANMKCIGLVKTKGGGYPTQHLVTSLREVTIKQILNLN